jgi:WD40 repeat protein
MFYLQAKSFVSATIAVLLAFNIIQTDFVQAQTRQRMTDNAPQQQPRAYARQKATLAGHSKDIYEIAFSPDGELLATGSEDGTIRLWNAGTGETKAVLALEEKHKLGGLLWSPDGSRLMTYSQRGRSGAVQFRIWDVNSGELKTTIETHYTNFLTDYKWSPDGRILLTASEDGTVELWDALTGRLQKSLEQAPLGPDETNSFLKSIFSHKKYADLRFTRGFFDAKGQSVITLSFNRSPRLWDAASGKLKNSLPLTEENTTDEYAFFPVNPLFSPDGRLVVRHDDDGISLLDTTTGMARHSLGKIGEPLAFSPDGLSLLVVMREPTSKLRDRADELKLYDVGSGQLQLVFEKVPEGVTKIYWSPDGGHVVMLGRFGTKTRLLDARTGRVKARLPYGGCTSDALWGSGGCESFHFSADGRVMLKQKNPLKLWSTETGELLATLEDMGGYARFSPTDKRVLVTRAKDKKTMLMWEVLIQ